MLVIPAAQLLDAWEQGHAASPGERGLLLLAVAHPEQPAASLAGWTVGRRDAALLALREQVFGPQLAALAECPRCDEPLDVEFPVSAITLPAPAAGDGSAPGDESTLRDEAFVLEVDGYRLLYRLPTAGDLAALGRNGGRDPARRLMERCLVEVAQVQAAGVEGQPGDLAPALEAALPEPVLEALASALAGAVAQADPQAEIELSLTCPACGAQWQTPFDIVTYLWQELDAWAARLLADVHVLASSYGWSEADILALSPWRRQRYLEMIGA
jgi:hypothetical protein